MKETRTTRASHRTRTRRSERGAAAVVARYIQELSGGNGGRRRALPDRNAKELVQ
jgi:hypothetical protein